MTIPRLLPLVFLFTSLVNGQSQTSRQGSSTTTGDFVIPDFIFDSGETLPELKLHYQTLGELKTYEDGSTNAVLLLHGSGGEGAQLLDEAFADTLFKTGQLLDAEKYFLILRDGIGHGNSSSPRNTGLYAAFPRYQYSDMVRADHRLLTEDFGIHHVRLIMGVSMGGIHSWM